MLCDPFRASIGGMGKKNRKSAQIPTVAQILESCGGMAVVRERIGVSRQAIEFWKRVPAHHVLDIEALSSRYDRHDMRPDVFGVREATA